MNIVLPPNAIWIATLLCLAILPSAPVRAQVEYNTLKLPGLGVTDDPDTTTTSGTVEWRSGDGILVSQGAAGTWGYGTPFRATDLTTGSKLLWNATTGAFRAGHFYWWSTPGIASAAFGESNAFAYVSFTANNGWATGDRSAAFNGGTSTGVYGFSGGWGTNASGTVSFAMGSQAQASAEASTALGSLTLASGYASIAAGVSTIAPSYGSLAIGRFNVGAVSATGSGAWIQSDPIFEIGIGSGSEATNRKNAVTVYKDGKVVISKRQGDILMGQFGAPGSGD